MPYIFLLLTWVNQATGVIHLPKGTINISSELKLPAGAHDLQLIGDETVLQAADDFQGRAILSCSGCRNITINGLTIDGNRDNLARPVGLPPSDVTFAAFSENNGLLFEDTEALVLSGLTVRNIAGFAILVSKSRRVLIEQVRVEASGSVSEKGRNNTTGGILIEEGSEDFEVRKCRLSDILGNGIWTHSLYTSRRNQNGRIMDNTFQTVGRDAIQVGHATKVRVERNIGTRVGFPLDKVDVEGGGTPVGLDTAGDVDTTLYAGNRFYETNGKCIDLDGFHDGEVRANRCINRGRPEEYPSGHFAIVMNNTNPDMQSQNVRIEGNVVDGAKFGGIFVIGSGHTVSGNRMRNLNMAHCNENTLKFSCLSFKDDPDILQSGIYFGRGAERPGPSHDSTVEDNVISGFNMDKHCITAAPAIKLETHRLNRNICTVQ